MAAVLNCGSRSIDYQTQVNKSIFKVTILKVDNNLTDSNESMANVFNHFFIESVHELASHFKLTDPEMSPEEHDNAPQMVFASKKYPAIQLKRSLQTTQCQKILII